MFQNTARNGPGILSLTNTLLFDGYKATQKQSGLKYPKMSHFHFARKKNPIWSFQYFFKYFTVFTILPKCCKVDFTCVQNIFSSLSWILI